MIQFNPLFFLGSQVYFTGHGGGDDIYITDSLIDSSQNGIPSKLEFSTTESTKLYIRKIQRDGKSFYIRYNYKIYRPYNMVTSGYCVSGCDGSS